MREATKQSLRSCEIPRSGLLHYVRNDINRSLENSMMILKKTRLAPMVLGVILLGVHSAFAQCPMCKASLVSSPEGQQMASAFNTGILFLLCVPFLVVGTIGFIIFNTYRRRKVTRWDSVKERITKPPKENETMKKYLAGKFIQT